METEEKTESASPRAMGSISWIIFIVVIVIVIASIIFVIMHPVGEPPVEDSESGYASEEEQPGDMPTELVEAPRGIERAEGSVVAYPLDGTADPARAVGGTQLPTTPVVTAPAPRFPEMGKKGALEAGVKGLLALPPGPYEKERTEAQPVPGAVETPVKTESPAPKAPKEPAPSETSEPDKTDVGAPRASEIAGQSTPAVPSSAVSKAPEKQQRKVVRRRMVKKVSKK